MNNKKPTNEQILKELNEIMAEVWIKYYIREIMKEE